RPVGQRGERRGGCPVVERRLARRLVVRTRRDEPLAAAEHLPGDEALPRLAARVERDARRPGERERRARRHHHDRFTPRRSEQLHADGAAVSVRRSCGRRPPTTTPAGATASSTRTATSAAATVAPCAG